MVTYNLPTGLENIKQIYDHMADEESKTIFENRLLYSLTGDMKYIFRVTKTTLEGNEVLARLKPDQRKVIFGAGVWGKNIFAFLSKAYTVDCFVDNNLKDGETVFCEGIPVISAANYLKNYRDAIVIISSRLYHQEILEQLISNGIPEEQIIDMGGVIDGMSKRQYFDLPALEEARKESEVFVDGGAFDGKTSLEFKKWCMREGGQFRKVCLFEPDIENQKKCEATLQEIRKKVEIIPKGLWDGEETLKFTSLGNGSSYIGETECAYEIQVTALDNVIQDEVTFIKLDIEGAEYEALCGAERIIKTYAPKLAISIYHKPEDIWKLPTLVLSYHENYRFYLRHYSLAASETVLYAISD